MNPLTSSLLGYGEYTVLPVTVLSVLTFTSEYASGLIRTTFTAVPRRRVVLTAKAAVTGAAALIAGELLAFACSLFTEAILSGHHRGLALSHPGALRAVLAAGFVLAACAAVGVGVGAAIRHTAGAVAAAVTVIYLLAVLCLVLPYPWKVRLGRFTLPFAAYQLVTLHPQPGLLSPGLSMLVLIGWPAAAPAGRRPRDHPPRRMTLPRPSDHSLMNRRELDHLGVAAARSGHTQSSIPLRFASALNVRTPRVTSAKSPR